MKKIAASIIGLSVVFGLFAFDDVSAWIGNGEGGSSGGGGGGGGSTTCTADLNTWHSECAGLSWAFYEATTTTTKATEFPYLKGQGARVSNAKVPAECSKGAGEGGGFWHFGLNFAGAYWYSGTDPAYTEIGVNSKKGIYGHWLTLNAGHPWTEWVPYKTYSLSGKNLQTVGVYRISKYGTAADVLKDYQRAWLQESGNAGKTPPNSLPSDTWAFCYGPYMSSHKITLKAVLEDTSSFSSSVADKVSSEAAAGTWVSVTRGKAPDGYSFLGFKRKNETTAGYVSRTSAGDKDYYLSGSSNKTYNEKIGDSDKTRYAVYVVNQYQGLSRVIAGGAEKVSTGYRQSNGQVIYTISNCAASGCSATIQHYLKRTVGTGNTTYAIKRTTSNISGVGTGFVVNSSTETFSSGNEVQERSQNYTLYPGQIVCETLIFNANKDTSNVKTTACISADGVHNSNPGVGLEVKNDGFSRWANYQTGTIYAKPGDAIHFRATYTPSGDQVYYTSTPEKYSLNGGTESPAGTSINSAQLGNISAIGWKNAFNLQITFPTTYNHNYTYNKGDTATKTSVVDHNVAYGEVGRIFNGTAKMNNVSGVRNTPKSVEFSTVEKTLESADSETGQTVKYFTKANVTTDSPEAKAAVAIPYNFANSTRVDTDASSTTLFAGETVNIGYTHTVGVRENSYTTATNYATTVYNPKWKLELCIAGGGCYETSEKTESSFSIPLAKMYTGDTFSRSTTISIPDVAAGTKVCVRSAVYPSSSGAATNWSDGEGSHAWAYSAQKCFVVAKKPSIQILGGNTYSNGKITTNVANKSNLAGVSGYGYNINTSVPKRTFGSWGELGVLANGDVSGFASAAALGYSLGGEYGEQHSQLSFGNAINTSLVEPTGKLGSTVMNATLGEDSNGIMTKFDYGGADNSSGTVVLNDVAKVKDGIFYYKGGELTIGDQTETNAIQAGTIQFVHASKIYISGNINYADNYQRLSDVPKLILYSEGAVNIDCNVSRIDALIIAGGEVKTCANARGTVPGVDDSARSRQLTIRGAVMAAKISADRTYGAATGANSIVPAEIINFDPTLYRFGEAKLSETEAGDMAEETSVDLNTVYLRELAPRL